METRERNSAAVERLHDQLQDSLRELVTSEDWRRALEVASRFHDYSFANTRLIWTQALARGFTPSRVAGYRTWQQLGRQVRRGERGLQILAPVIRKVTVDNDEDEAKEQRRVVGFRVVHVFDISQTDGEPLPEVTAALVEGDLPAQWSRVAELIGEAGFDLKVANLDRLGDANGITDWQRRDVVIRADLPGAQRFKTAVHELAHIRLHKPTSEGRPNCRGIVEVEAESVAYMVCAALGIDSAGYSLPYVASWSGGDLDKVAATANRVIGCARSVLTQLEQGRHLDLDRTSSLGAPRLEVRDRTTSEPELNRENVRGSELQEVIEMATAIFQRHLQGPRGARARDYLEGRGIGDTAMDRWQLGYAPDSWQWLTQELLREGFEEELLVDAGVVGRSRTGRLYDRMRNRIIFPLHGEDGTPRGFAGRLLSGDGPKYLNTPETSLYQKRTLLYGFHLARQPITDTGPAVVVEGYMDAIAAHQADITNVVATGGTALTPEHLQALRQVTGDLTLAFDGDPAGLLAVEHIAELEPAAHGLRVRVARLPDRRDPADLVAAGRPEVLQQAINQAVPLEHHLIDRILIRHNLDEPEDFARALRAAGAIVASIREPHPRAEALAHLATEIGRDQTWIEAAVIADTPQRERYRGSMARLL